MSEYAFIRWTRGQIGKRRGRILVDSGDDCAVVRFRRESVLFKTDSVIEGVHFKSGTKPELIGHKAIARPLSDIAAMGCIPSFSVVAMSVPYRTKLAWLKRVAGGMFRTAKRFGVAVVGGDVASHPGKLVITVSLLGETGGLRPILRSGARSGDLILVTGALGGSIRGKHLMFTPRVKEGMALNRRYDIHSMIDISDGLVRDLGHLCEESGVGAILDSKKIPVSRGATLEGALYDGEDYELLFTTSPREARKTGARIIGEITSKRGIRFLDGKIVKVSGWEHPFA